MQIKDFLNRLDDSKKQKLGEVIRFGIVGVAATLLQYVIYLGLVYVIPSDVSDGQKQLFSSLAMTLGYAISFVFNFIASTKFTFKVKANAKRGAGFALSHAVNYLLQMVTLNFFIWLGLSNKLAPIPMFCICVPVNFILVRFFLKR